MNEAPRELILKPSPQKWFGLALFVALCIPVGLCTILRGTVLGWLFLILGTFLTLFCLCAPFVPRMRLHLTETGFSFGSLRRRSTYRWSDIAHFFPLEFGGQRHVGFNFSPTFTGGQRDERVRRINQGFGGFDRFLPDNYGLERKALAQLLESWRLAHSDDRSARP